MAGTEVLRELKKPSSLLLHMSHFLCIFATHFFLEEQAPRNS